MASCPRKAGDALSGLTSPPVSSLAVTGVLNSILGELLAARHPPTPSGLGSRLWAAGGLRDAGRGWGVVQLSNDLNFCPAIPECKHCQGHKCNEFGGLSLLPCPPHKATEQECHPVLGRPRVGIAGALAGPCDETQPWSALLGPGPVCLGRSGDQGKNQEPRVDSGFVPGGLGSYWPLGGGVCPSP